MAGRAAGHWDRVRELLKVHGDPPNSFKRWERELYPWLVRAQSKTKEPLCKGRRPAVVSPDGKATDVL